MANIATILLTGSALTILLVTQFSHAADPVFASASPPAVIPLFSNQLIGAAPKDWAFQPIRNASHPTKYALVRDEELGITVLEGSANAAAGVLIYRLDGDARVNSILRFKWKAGNLIVSSDPRTKGGDDYVARIYVTFAVDPERASVKERAENAIVNAIHGETPPHTTLSYVFAHKAALGAIITSPFTQRVKKLLSMPIRIQSVNGRASRAIFTTTTSAHSAKSQRAFPASPSWSIPTIPTRRRARALVTSRCRRGPIEMAARSSLS
jgi:hypothetical protein